VQRPVRPERDRGSCVRHRSFDLPAVPDDRRVGEQPLDVAAAELRDAVRLEPLERGSECVALSQDREPGEAGLEPLQAQALVEAPLVPDRTAPLLVVICVVGGVARLPAADERAQSTTSTWTTPSSTVTE
jgi:hypothetical protein